MMSKFAGFALCSVLAVATLTNVTRSAAAETACMSDDEAVCKAEKDERMAIYTQGRNAYDNARMSGDFTEAFSLSRKLASTGDKNGERLLKMVYIQLGSGAHRDTVQAYVWISEGIADGIDYAALWRKKLTEKMTPEQLAQAKKLAGS